MSEWRTLAFEDLVEADDPCGLVKKLKTARLLLVAGEKEVEIEFQGVDQRRVKYHVPSMVRLDQMISALEADCARKQGKRARRPGIAYIC